MSTTRRLITAVAIAALFATTAAGFPTRNIPPAKWADHVCGSVKEWVSAIQAKAKSVQTELGADTSVAATKRTLVSFLGASTSQTAHLVDRLESSGTPDTPKGKGARLALTKGFAKVETTLHGMQREAKAVNASHPKAAAVALRRIGVQMQTRLGNMGDSFGNLDHFDPGKHLKKAFGASKVCKTLSN